MKKVYKKPNKGKKLSNGFEEFTKIGIVVRASDLSGSKTVQAHVWTNEVEKEDESGDSGVSRVKGVEAAFSFVPSLKLSVKRFDEIVRNVVVEALDANMVSVRKETFNRNAVSGIAVGDNGAGITKLLCMIQNGVSLGRITAGGEVKAKDEAGFGVDDEPDVVLDPADFDDSFVGVPLVGVEVHRWNEFNGDVVEQRCEFLAPCRDGNV